MGLYIRNNRYYYKKQINRKTYYCALNLKKGQEALLSARLRQVEAETLAKHYGIEYESFKQISFLDYTKKYMKAKQGNKKSWDRDGQRLIIVSKCWGDPPVSIIDKSYIEKLEKFLFQRKLKYSTVNRYFEMLKHFFNLAIEDGYIKSNPVKYYQPFVEDETRRALTTEEIKKVLESAKKIQNKPKTNIQSLIYDLVLFALNTGMRLSEIINLRKSYIQEDIIIYPVSETKYRKRLPQRSSQKAKVICLNIIAQGIIAKQKSNDSYVFPIERRYPSVIRKVIYKIRKLSGIKDFQFHQLRHTTSTIISAAVGLATAKLILGHADLKTTLRYSHPGLDEQRKGVAKIGEFISGIAPK